MELESAIKSYATFSIVKHEDWLRTPLNSNLLTVPGLGRSGVDALKSAGITDTWQLIGKYMSFGPNGIAKFHEYLSQFTAISRHRDTITRAVAEKVAISFGILVFNKI
jgi:hypothetical protein